MWTAETVFVCALALLGRTQQSFPAVEFVEKAPQGVSPLAEAYSLTEEKRIVLVTSSWAFRTALGAEYRCGQIDALRQIAGVLAHEEWHIHHGGNEEGAYDAQLITLLAVGTPLDSPLYHKVKRAKETVLAAERRAARAPVMARGR